MLGRPMWSGIPAEAAFEKDRDSELWYEYDGADGSPGRMTIVMNQNGVVVTALVYPKKPFGLQRCSYALWKPLYRKKVVTMSDGP